MARFTDEAYLKQWRQRQLNISSSSAFMQSMVERIQHSGGISGSAAELFTKVLQDASEVYLRAVEQSCTEDDNAYKLSYLRNFTQAYYLASSRRKTGSDDFLQYFGSPIWGEGDHILTEALGKDQCSKEREEAALMDRYMQLMVHIYCNRLINLANGDTNLEVLTSGKLVDEFKELHAKYESEKAFDEIAVIRYQLVQAVKADTPSMLLDEAASRVFQVDAYELLSEYNTKPMGVDLSR